MIIHVSEQERVVDNPEHVYQVLSGYFATLDKVDRDKEHFFVLHLDVRNKINVKTPIFGTHILSIVV